MRKRFLLTFTAMVVFLTACIDFYDSNSVIQLASDQRIIGVWQDLESEAEFGLRFTADEHFYTLFMEEFILEGSYTADGQILELQYFNCDDTEECEVRLGYTVTGDTLVITSASGDIRLRRIGN